MAEQNNINSIKQNQLENEVQNQIETTQANLTEEENILNVKPVRQIEDEIKDDAFYEEEIKRLILKYFYNDFSL